MSAILGLLVCAQAATAIRVAVRLIRTSGGRKIATVPAATRTAADRGAVSVIVPVRNEEQRLGPCLAALGRQPDVVAEIIVVDGGSTDATTEVIGAAQTDDRRVRRVDASPVPPGWNGKAWGLQTGFEAISSEPSWVLTIDADVRVGPDLVTSLLAHADKEAVAALSVATAQTVTDGAQAALHPALLATLVYRYGIPGQAAVEPEAVQANGQAFLARVEALCGIDGFRSGRHSLCEDVTIARELVRHGVPHGFFEAKDGPALIRVEMYRDWRDAWQNWTRSLPMRDARSGRGWWLRMADLTLAAGLPIPLLAILLLVGGRGHGSRSIAAALRLNVGLCLMRIGVAVGMRRAYVDAHPLYWLSPALDPLVVAKVWLSAMRRDHIWRGRPVRRGR